jgi:outer membrane protein OmpA-like peptidoglycan-associated protein
MAEEELIIDARKTDKINNLLTGRKHSIRVKRNYEVNVIEMEDINFHFDSAVLLPDYGPDAPQPGTEEQNRVTGLAVIYACYRHSEKENFLQKILVAGHTDKSGPAHYNIDLSQRRAENVFFMFVGERAKWVDSSLAKNQVEDVQQILKWISFNFQYDCDPGEKTNKMNPETSAAIEKFQKRYNLDFVDLKKHENKFVRTFTRIDEDGKMGKQTWGAFFDMYVLELLIVMGIKEEGLIDIQSRLDFIKKSPGSPAPVVGCGENFPKSGSTTEDPNPVDRRVEILFFDETEEPELKCHPAKLVCKHKLCDLYNTKDVFVPVPVKVDPLPLPSGVAVRVHLKFIYKAPEGDERPFPKGFPFILKFGDGTTEQHSIDNDTGQVFLQVLREKKSFTIEFKFSETHYIASPENGTDEIVPESQVQDKVKNNFRVFSLPLEWNLKNSEWELSPSVSNFDDTEKEFKNLNDLSVENIGSEASPIDMKLDPHWQFYKFLYFDRFLKEKLSILPLLIETLLNNSGSPEIKSSWVTKSEGSLATPFIKRDTALNNLLLQFRTEQNTFIESKDDGSREYVSGTERNTPNADRLRFYDMPVVWKSKNYFARLSGGKDQPAAKEGLFNDLFKEQTEDEKPLIISLDDIILTDDGGEPINWKPDENRENRITIFHHSFSRSGPQKDDLSSEGIYKPDGTTFIDSTTKHEFTKNKLGFFTQLPKDEKDRNYISDYPDWTRAVIAQGNIFDVFDKRTEEGKSDVVGARAGVRVFDVFSSKDTFVPPEEKRPAVPKPKPEKNSFCHIQALFEQEHEVFNKIGRFDIIRLRCADVAKDRKTEISICIIYLRLFFNFDSKIKPAFNPKAKPLKLTGDDAKDWVETAMLNLMHRWNGPDKKDKAIFNTGPAFVLPLKDDKKFKSKVIWFSQDLPKEKAHFEIGIFEDKTDDFGVRGFMRSRTGEGVLDKIKKEPQFEIIKKGKKINMGGAFTFAHEVGHGGSLVDEYFEPTRRGNSLPGFDYNSPGSPFSLDGRSMMKSNLEVRARHYWHIAEWFRQIDSLEYKIKHGKHEYFIPHDSKAPIKNFIGWPGKEKPDVELGEHGKFNIYFYPLGKEKYSSFVLPNLAKSPGDFDGILIVFVKIEFDFPTKDDAKIGKFLSDADDTIDKKFNFPNKFGAKGNQLGQEFKKILLHFEPRYFEPNFSTTKRRDKSEHIKVKIKKTGKAEWDSKHKLTFPMDKSASDFADFFGNMIGLADGTFNDPKSYEPIAKKVIPDAEVFTL